MCDKTKKQTNQTKPYIYICVCVCVCVVWFSGLKVTRKLLGQILAKNFHLFWQLILKVPLDSRSFFSKLYIKEKEKTTESTKTKCVGDQEFTLVREIYTL